MQYESHGGTDMDIPSDIGNILHQIFVNMPLAVEIRCVLDFARVPHTDTTEFNLGIRYSDGF